MPALLLLLGLFLGFSPLLATDRVYQRQDVRIFYEVSGRHAVVDRDINRNRIPDQVEDLMTQVQAARLLFVEVLGFPEPLGTERFRSAKFIDIHLRHHEVLKMNGVAYDELQRFNKAGDPADTRSLCFNVATSVMASTNLTPAHEFFHLIQYSTTYFKNRWFLEGTARWSERALGAGHLGPTRILSSWPLPEEKVASITAMAYDAAEHFWNPLAQQNDDRGQIPDSPKLQQILSLTYTDGSPVLKDLQLRGAALIRDILIELDRVDDVAFREQKYDRWSEANQRSSQNNAYLFAAIEEVVSRRREN